MWRDSIVSEARTWVGTKYHHKGRIKGVGVDCGGLIYEVYKKVLGIPAEPFPSNYAEDWGLHQNHDEKYLNFIMPYVVEIPPIKLQPADIIVFKFGRAFAHGAIYAGAGNVIHAYGRTSHGGVIVSPIKKFGIALHPREYKSYTLDSKWLSSQHSL